MSDSAQLIAGGDGISRLVVMRGGSGLAPVVAATFPTNRYSDFYLEKAKPGLVRTWCGKGGGDDKAPCARKTILIRADTLAYGQRESTMSVAHWNGTSFEVILISD